VSYDVMLFALAPGEDADEVLEGLGEHEPPATRSSRRNWRGC